MATTLRFTTHCLAALGLSLCGTACNDLERVDEGNGSGDAIPPDVQRAFDETCGTAGCHSSADRAAGLDLSAAAAPSIIGGPSSSSLPMVDPGNINGSYLAVKMLETPPEGTTRTGARMPIGGDFGNVNNLIILGWIATATDAGGGGQSTGDMPMSSEEGSSGSGGSVVACGLDDVAPAADNPYDIGMDAGQIPPDVGQALTDNCGCHGVADSELIAGAPPYSSGRVPFSTIAEFQADIEGETAAQIVLGRLESEASPMPPNYYCDLGGGEVITADDQQLLIDWLNAGTPDAPSWMP